MAERKPIVIDSGLLTQIVDTDDLRTGRSVTYPTTNIIIGDADTGASITTAVGNVLIGANAGDSITGDAGTGGDENVYIGEDAGQGNALGLRNIAIGALALSDNNFVGDTNMVFGYAAGLDLEDGTDNMLIGRGAGSELVDANRNVFIGDRAGAATVTSQSVNVDDCVCLGNMSYSTGDNAIAIGADVFAAANEIVIGNTSHTDLVTPTDVSVRDGTSARTLFVYNTYTDGSNYERTALRWDTNVFEICTESAGTGTDRDLVLCTGGTERGRISSTGVFTGFPGSGLDTNFTGYGSGTAYTLTNTMAELNRGTTDSAITIDETGTYIIEGQATFNYVAADFSGIAGSLEIKLRRTNNTAADLSNSMASVETVQISGGWDGGMQIRTQPVEYTTSNTDDRIALFVRYSSNPSSGGVVGTSDSILARRIGS